jgi:transposase
MSMVCGLDLHRSQITFDVLEEETGEVWKGRLWKPDRHRFRRWLEHEVRPRAVSDGDVKIAVEGCTGWRYVVEEIQAAGFEAHVGEPADTQAMRGRKKHAKTDRTDARLLRDLLQAGELPESWIPPAAVLEWRERTRLYKSLIDERAVWVQRIHAELYQHGVAVPEEHIRSDNTRQLLLTGTDLGLSQAARQRIRIGYRMIDATHSEAEALREQVARFARKQKACRALIEGIYGFGPTAAVVVWSELGDCRRFTRSRQVVRHTGLDVTVDASNTSRHGGFLSRQGPGTLRWALFEAGLCASRTTSPDRDYYRSVKERSDGKLAAICVARKLARRSYHILRSMDPEDVYAIPET